MMDKRYSRSKEITETIIIVWRAVIIGTAVDGTPTPGRSTISLRKQLLDAGYACSSQNHLCGNFNG